MRRLTRRLVVGTAFLAVALAGLAGTPAEARHFGRFGYGFGFPVVYAPSVVPVYVPPPVYAVYPPPVAYHYGYRYRIHRTYRRVTYRHVVHHRWCGRSCCR